MNEIKEQLESLNTDLKKAKQFFLERFEKSRSTVRIFTHIDADGLSAGAIIGKALYRANIPFQITVLRQLEKQEIKKIAVRLEEYDNFLIFTDFGSGQYLELEQNLRKNENLAPFLILDHHLPQEIANKEEIEKLEQIHQKTTPWHINPYFYGIDGSGEICGAGMSYLFAKCLDKNNRDLSVIALIGATGDIQNQGKNKAFIGANTSILNDAVEKGLIEVVDDLNFSPIKPLNEAIAYSKDVEIPVLSGDPNRTLLFLQQLGVLMEDKNGNVRTLNDLTQREKQKITSAIIEYVSLKLDVDPTEIIQNLIANRYVLKNESPSSALSDTNEFSSILNACGRTSSGSLGIAIAMGDRKNAYQEAQENLAAYRKSLVKALNWVIENEKIQQKPNIQFFFGEEVIRENIIGTISSMLIMESNPQVDIFKPIFGLALREEEGVYKVSGRASEYAINKGVNLSEAIREASKLSEMEALGGGHPPAAGTKVSTEKVQLFLENIDKVIKEQQNNVDEFPF